MPQNLARFTVPSYGCGSVAGATEHEKEGIRRGKELADAGRKLAAEGGAAAAGFVEETTAAFRSRKIAVDVAALKSKKKGKKRKKAPVSDDDSDGDISAVAAAAAERAIMERAVEAWREKWTREQQKHTHVCHIFCREYLTPAPLCIRFPLTTARPISFFQIDLAEVSMSGIISL